MRVFTWNLPTTKHNDRTVSGIQLHFQICDHDGIVSKCLFHCQKTNLRNAEGVLAKWQRFAIIPLDEGREQIALVKGVVF